MDNSSEDDDTMTDTPNGNSVKPKPVDDADSFVGQGVQIQGDDDTFLMKMMIEDFESAQIKDQTDEPIDKTGIIIFGTVPDYVFDQIPEVDDLDADDFNLYLEIDKDQFRRRIRKTVSDVGVPAVIQLDPSDDPAMNEFAPDVSMTQAAREQLVSDELLNSINENSGSNDDG